MIATEIIALSHREQDDLFQASWASTTSKLYSKFISPIYVVCRVFDAAHDSYQVEFWNSDYTELKLKVKCEK